MLFLDVELEFDLAGVGGGDAELGGLVQGDVKNEAL